MSEAMNYGLCLDSGEFIAADELNSQAEQANRLFDERDARITELLANEKVLLAQIQGHTQWREKIIKASEQAYGESAVRYKFSLTKNGKCMNTFPKEIDGRWFALAPAEDDGHIGHIARIAELERELAEVRKQMDAQKDEWLSWEAKRSALEKDAERWRTFLSTRPQATHEVINQAIDDAAMKGQQ